MELKWTDKALSDLVRLHAFLAPVNGHAAARLVQSLAAAPSRLTVHPRLGEKIEEFDPREFVASSSAATKCATNFKAIRSISCVCGTHARSDSIDVQPCASRKAAICNEALAKVSASA